MLENILEVLMAILAALKQITIALEQGENANPLQQPLGQTQTQPNAGASQSNQVDPSQSNQVDTSNSHTQGTALNSQAGTPNQNTNAGTAQGTGNTPPKNVTWDPTVEAIQGSYRTKDKQQALNDAVLRLNLSLPNNATYAKKHQAIIDHVNQFGAAPAETPMTWAEFSGIITERAAAGGRDLILSVVQELEGHQVLAEANVKPENYQAILDRTAPVDQVDQVDQGAVQHQQPVQQQPLSLTQNRVQSVQNQIVHQDHTLGQQQPGPTAGVNMPDGSVATVTNVDQLCAHCTNLTAQGVAPETINNAIAAIAPMPMYVPADRVAEAFAAINQACGA